MLVGGIVDGQTGQTCQNLSGHPVSRTGLKYSFRRNDIVVAILGNFRPEIFGDRFVPRQAKLLMVNAQLNLKFLQGLLLGTEIVDISVRNVIGFAIERILITADDTLRQFIQLLICGPQHPGIKHVVIVLAAVETNQTEPHEFFHVCRCRVDHPNEFLVFTLVLPVDQKQVWKHLTVKEYNRRFVVLDSR